MGSIYQDKQEYAVSTWTMDRFSLEAALETIHQNGFQTVEIWADNVHIDPRLHPDIEAARRALRARGQNVHSVHSPFRWFDPRPEGEKAFRAYRMDLWKQTIDACAALDSPIMVVHALDRIEYNYRADQVQIIGDCLSDLCAYGAPRGVSIALENIADGRGDGEFCCTLKNQAACFPGIGLKFCLDIGHVPLSGADMMEEIAAAGENLITLHIHNNDLVSDAHNLPDDGLLDWPALHAHLRATGYTGQFVMEVLGRGNQAEVVEQIAGLFK